MNAPYIPYYAESSLHRLRMIGSMLKEQGQHTAAEEIEQATLVLRDLIAMRQRAEGKEPTV